MSTIRTLGRTAAAATVLALGAASAAVAAPDTTAPDSTAPEGSAADGAACAGLAEPVTLKWGIGASPAYAHVYLADQRGYFAEENIEVEFVTVNTPADNVPLLVGGELDLANAGMSAGLFNAIARGLEVQIVASHGQYARDAPAPAGFYVRSELIESGEVTEIADLAGLDFGLAGGSNDVGNAGGYLLSLVLAEGGLTLADVNLVNIAIADVPAAFESGAIDATFVPGAVAPIVEEDGTAQPFGDPNVLAERVQGGTLIGPNLAEQPEVAEAVLHALFRAAADLQGDYRQDETVIDDLVASGVYDSERLLGDPYYYFDPELRVDQADVEEFQQIFIDFGGVIESGELLPYEQLVGTEIYDNALGSYVACHGG